MSVLDIVLQRLLQEEQDFLARHFSVLMSLQQAADQRPVLEEAYARSFLVRRELEEAFATYQASLTSIARFAHLPSHARLLKLLQEQRPSEKARLLQSQQNRLLALYFEEKTRALPQDESLTEDLANVFQTLQELEQPPPTAAPAWKQTLKYAGSAVAGAVAASVATWLWKMRQQQAKSRPSLTSELSPMKEAQALPSASTQA